MEHSREGVLDSQACPQEGASSRRKRSPRGSSAVGLTGDPPVRERFARTSAGWRATSRRRMRFHFFPLATRRDPSGRGEGPSAGRRCGATGRRWPRSSKSGANGPRVPVCGNRACMVTAASARNPKIPFATMAHLKAGRRKYVAMDFRMFIRRARRTPPPLIARQPAAARPFGTWRTTDRARFAQRRPLLSEVADQGQRE